MIQFIHSSFKECLFFCYWSFKIFQGKSCMIMPSGGHKFKPLSIIDASFLFLLFFFFLFSLFSFSLKTQAARCMPCGLRFFATPTRIGAGSRAGD